MTARAKPAPSPGSDLELLFQSARISPILRDAVERLRIYVDAGNGLRLAVAQALIVSTPEEVRMPRADWDKIVDAAIAQRRVVDPTAVPDE